MTRDEFHTALRNLITDSTDMPIEQVAEELHSALEWVSDLEKFEAEHILPKSR